MAALWSSDGLQTLQTRQPEIGPECCQRKIQKYGLRINIFLQETEQDPENSDYSSDVML